MSNLRQLAVGLGFDGANALKGIGQVDKGMDGLKGNSKSLGKSFEQIGIDAEKSVKHIGNQYKLWNLEASDMDKVLQGNKMHTQALGDQIGVLDGAIGQTGLALQKTKKDYGDNSEEAKKLEQQLLELKVSHAELNKELEDSTGLNKLGQNMQTAGSIMTDVGKTMTMGVTAPIVGLGALAANSAIEAEDAFAGVKKTVDEDYKGQLDEIRKDFDNMSLRIPVDVTELYEIGEAAGQLGVKTKDITQFSEVIANLGATTNLTTDTAASELAKFANITQMNMDDIDRLGSTIVGLGNNLATTESDIVSMSMRLAGAGKQIGLSEAQIMSFSGALSSVGIEAEAGGSSFSKVMLDMNTSVLGNTKDLSKFAKIAGVSSKEFADTFKKDASSALVMFTEGLGELSNSGANVAGILDDLGFSEIRVRDALLRASGAGDLFRESLELGNKAWEENTALTDEAAQKYETTASQIQMAKNNFRLLADDVGKIFLPTINEVLKKGREFAEWFRGLGEGPKKAILTFALIAAAIGPVLVVFGTLVGSIGSIVSNFGLIKSAVGLLGKGLGNAFGIMFNPWVIGIGIAIAVGILLYKNWDAIKEKAGQLKDWIVDKWNGIKESTSEAWNGIKTAVSDKWNSLKDTISNVGPNIKNGVLNTWDNIKTGTTDKWNNIKSIASNSMDSLKGVISTLASNLPSGVIEGLTKMKDGILNIFEGVKNIFGGQLKVIKNIFLGGMLVLLDIVTLDFASLGGHIAQIWGNIKEGFVQIWQGIGQVFTGAGQYIKGYLMSLWEGIKSGIQIAWRATTDFLFNTWESIKIGAVEGWNSLKESIANIVTSSVEWIKVTWNSMIEWFATLPSRLYESGVQMFTSLKDGLSSLVPAIISKATEVSTAIVDGVKNLPSAMLEIGKNIIQGLINGIAGKLGALKEKASEIAESVKSKIKGALDIHSPSRVMIEYGQFTSEGLAIGMENKKALAESAASELSSLAIEPLYHDFDVQSNTSYPMSSEPVVSNASSNSGDSIVFSPNITINLQSGSKEEAEMSTRELEKYFDKWLENYLYKMSLIMT